MYRYYMLFFDFVFWVGEDIYIYIQLNYVHKYMHTPT